MTGHVCRFGHCLREALTLILLINYEQFGRAGGIFMSRIALLTFVLLSYNLVVAQVPDQAKVIAGADRAVERAAKLSPPNAPGCVVGVSLDGKSVYEKGFGMAD